MQNNLVIVESPAKAKTIEKFLGSGYKVLSSYGHIRDLKQKSFSIDVEKDFNPIYEIPADKKKLVSQLKEEAAGADMVWLASDEDREGEAISWHLYEVLGLSPERSRRIVFHEITRPAIIKAIEKPRGIDLRLVDAQQARRVLDRIVGFELSPVLWKRIKPALSAGRVQSVAVRLIVEREREINAYTGQAWFKVWASFLCSGGVEVKAELGRKLASADEAANLLEKCANSRFKIEEVATKRVKRQPAPPFTTSTLQQEASRKLGYTVAQTMMLAQRLYENGFITYMRTDSVNLSELALASASEVIGAWLGSEYSQPRKYSTHSKGAQEAHEAIRPAYMDKEKIEGTTQEQRLYDLIRKRTLASQMTDAEIDRTTVTIGIDGSADKFVAVGQIIVFDGFLRVYREGADDDSDKDEEIVLLPSLAEGEILELKQAGAVERFSQAPARYTEASLVRKMEELGIGRPSTYAPTISTIQQRGYVEKGSREGTEREYRVLGLDSNGKVSSLIKTETTGSEKHKLLPTDVGIVVTDFLMQYFPGIMDYNFTSGVEKEFDAVAEGEMAWNDMIRKFYDAFHPLVVQNSVAGAGHKVGERQLGLDPVSGKPVFVKIGRFGPVAQIGAADSEEKPRFAQLRPGMSLETVSLEEVLELFRFPRMLGVYEDEEISIGAGKFGPYIKHGKAYVSIPKDMDPLSLSLDDAVKVIVEKKEAEARKFIKSFDDVDGLQILNGRYGPYIAYNGKNYKIPEDVEPNDLTAETCFKIIELQKIKKETKRSRKKA